MNDDELITMLREQRGKIPMDVPAEQIVSRGRALRARRRVPGVTAALGVAAAAGLAVAAVLPTGHPASAAHAQLTAWTVVKQTDGNIKVTIRELENPAGLQHTLRADGVPASVTFSGQQNPACQQYPQAPTPKMVSGGNPQGQTLMVIHPSALPSAVGLQIYTVHHSGFHGIGDVLIDLVHISPQCTGS